ncbi:MAG TPA: restriction endonuclease subunit S [Acidothermaceae bacterium]|jgi:type I restriction enzyme S subunit|nr:restriction endonuclease subunit S [Acidothermaceae bacterium]
MTPPTGWRRVTLGSLGRYVNGRAFKKQEWAEHGRPIIRIQNLTGTSSVFNFYADDDVPADQVARSGDLLVAWAATLGAYIWTGPEAVINQHIFKVESSIDVRFHKYLLDHKLTALMDETHGSGMVHITRGRFEAIPVDLPPPRAQRRIVEVLEDHLSRLDAAAAEVSSSRRRQETWRRQSLDQLVRETASGRTTLGALVRRIEAGRSFGGSASPARSNEWGIIKVSAMTWGNFRPGENKAVGSEKVDPRHEIRPGDVLVSRANTTEYVGAPVLVGATPARLLLSDKSLRLIPAEGVAPRWLVTVLAARSTRQQVSRLASGTKDSMRNISQQALLSVTVPSATAAQQVHVMDRAAMFEETADRLQSELTATEERAARLRQSLLSAAFSGRLSDGPGIEPIEGLTHV